MTNNSELEGKMYFLFNDQKTTSNGIDKIFRIMNSSIKILLLTHFCNEIYLCSRSKWLVYISKNYNDMISRLK